MFCKNCGAKLEENAMFCGECGTRVLVDEVVNSEPIISMDSMSSNGNMNNINNEPIVSSVSEDLTDNINGDSIVSMYDTVSNEPIVSMDGSANPTNNLVGEQPVINNTNINQSSTLQNNDMFSNGDNFFEVGNDDNSINDDNNRKKSNLKNIIIIAIILIVLGCGSAYAYFTVFAQKSNAEIIESAVNNMTSIKSFTLGVNADFLVNEDEKTTDGKISLNGDVDLAKKMASVNGSVGVSGTTFDIPAYVDFGGKSGLIYFKVPTMDTWSKIDLGEEFIAKLLEASESADTYKDKNFNIKSEYSGEDFIKKINSDDKNLLHYQFMLTDENIKKLNDPSLETKFSDLGVGAFNIDIYINKSENYITKLEIDLSGKTINDNKYDKFIMSVSLTNLNSISDIVIPSDAKLAQDFDTSVLSGILGNTKAKASIDFDNIELEPGVTINTGDSTIIGDEEKYVEDYTIQDNGYSIKYNIDSSYEASSVNDKDFKIYRTNDLRYVLDIAWKIPENYLKAVELTKTSYESDTSYSNVNLSDIKELTVGDKKVSYRTLEYTYGTSGVKQFKVFACYQLDNTYSYTVEIENNKSAISEDAIKVFFDNIVITKVQN